MLVPSALMQSMASFVSQNVGAGKAKRAKKSMFTGIGVGLVVGCFVFTLVFLKGDVLAGIRITGGVFRGKEGCIMRLHRNTRLVFAFGNMTVAVSYLHAFPFEKID